MKLVTLEDELPVFNPEARTIKEFKDIIVRDKGNKGDADGRKKAFALKELAYVHFMTYYNSEFITSYPEDIRPEKVRQHLALPEDWKPDALIGLACMTYKELMVTPSMNSLIEAREALFGADKLLRIYRKKFEEVLQQMDSQITGLEDAEQEAMNDNLLAKSDKLYARIMDISKKMPDALETINKLEERVKKEMQAEQKGRGKTDVNMQELAD